MATFKRPLKVGKIDNYTLELDADYLNGETITGVNVTSADGNLSVNSFLNDDSTISALCTGITKGDAVLHYDWTTQTRSGCEKHTVIILDC